MKKGKNNGNQEVTKRAINPFGECEVLVNDVRF